MKTREYFMRTERTGFSVWEKDDFDLACMLWGNPSVTQYICASGVFSKKDITDRLCREISNQQQYAIQYWPVFSLSDGKLIGCCGLRPHNKNTYEIGFHLLPEYWGKGYACETASAVIDYAFEILHAEKLFAGHHPDNIASQKVLYKLGFSFKRNEYYAPTGLMHPSYEKKNM